MAFNENLKRMIEANAVLWAGEAEIVRTYWTSPVRTHEADKLWLRRQCWKEYVGVAKFDGPTVDVCLCANLVSELKVKLPKLDASVDRHELRELIDTVQAEFTHYCLFADIYDSLLEPGEPRINANELTLWPEEDELAKYRNKVRTSLPKYARATRFTEGGYCTMYSEGAKLQGRPGVDGQIGRACQKVYDDEFGHMMWGILGTEVSDLTADDWKELTHITCEILRLRLFMRNAQFSHPVTESRMKLIVSGDIAPVRFDYQKADAYFASHGTGLH